MIVESEVSEVDVVTQQGLIVDTPVALSAPSHRFEGSTGEYCGPKSDGDRDDW